MDLLEDNNMYMAQITGKASASVTSRDRERILSMITRSCLKVRMKYFFLLLNLKEQQKSGRLPFTVS